MATRKVMPTKEQVLVALQTHKTLYRAAYIFGVTSPTLKKWMRHYGIVVNRNVKQEPADTPRLSWYQRIFRKRK